MADDTRDDKTGVHLCECGCGLYTSISDRNRYERGVVKGQPRRYVQGHNALGKRAKRKAVTLTRRKATTPDGRNVLWHRWRAERALGKPLPPRAEVHHADGSNSEDAPLVICEDRAYHALLHTRMRILRAGGDPNSDRVCRDCGPQPKAAFIPDRRISTGVQAYCRACCRTRARARRVA